MHEIQIYGHIGFEVTAADVRASLAAANPAEPVLAVINSPGGWVTEGLAIITNLSSHPGGYHARVDGVAASMAAEIATRADHLSMPADAWLMFHRAAGGGGTADELEEQASRIRRMEEGMILRLMDAFPDKSRAEVLSALDREWWIPGSDAVAAGLAHSLLPGAAVAAEWSEADFRNPPAELKRLEPRRQKSQNALQLFTINLS